MFRCSIQTLLISFTILIPYIAGVSLSVSSVSLTTTLGQVTGIRKPASGDRIVDVFYGIPFAKPPTGKKRFRSPEPAQPWEGSLDGTRKPSSCWQPVDTSSDRLPDAETWNPNTPMSEDCLYLNVWRPLCTQNCSRTELKSILVWIFGGGFYSGTTTLNVYDATELSALNDVIVVSVAYRLGALGFLYTGDDNVPGNAGLLDQALGLKWIKDNAANLGGNPESITIFGESAGAASVGLHLLSPISKNYFTYAIMQSGAPISEWAVVDGDLIRNRTLALAEYASCSNSNTSSSIDCLRSVNPETLINKHWSAYRPVVDGYFLPDHPFKMAERGDIKNTSVLLGVNEDEGIYFAFFLFKEYFPLEGDGEITKDQFDNIILTYFSGNHTKSDIVKSVYMKNSNASFTDVVDDVIGDLKFKCSIITFAEQLSRHNRDVFLYSFEERLSTNPFPKWAGVPHGYEIEVVFGLPLAPDSLYTEEEKALSLRMMKLWTNFAKTGNPNYNQNNDWPKYTSNSNEYVIIDAAGLTVGQGLRESECGVLAEVGSLPTTKDASRVGTNSPERIDNQSIKIQTQNISFIFTLTANIQISNSSQITSVPAGQISYQIHGTS